MKHCSAFNCANPIWSNGYCKFHLYLSPKAKNKGKEARYSIRRTKPSPISNKRALDNNSYREVCREIDREAIANKEYVCFFCGVGLWGIADHHHLRGKVGKLLTDKRYLVLAHRDCHSEYHSLSISGLLETGWYGSFLIRLCDKDQITFEKEMRKLEKYFEL